MLNGKNGTHHTPASPSSDGSSSTPVLNRYAHIVGWGMYVPQRVMTNDDIARIVVGGRGTHLCPTCQQLPTNEPGNIVPFPKRQTLRAVAEERAAYTTPGDDDGS